ncbi:putative amino-acid import ATP-binding protein YxeO [Paenibacillus solanacearum]|uniref:Amino-acid import ATP-binding protein YxeO n=1 Tax=Paenibacillus solanacearum TaxID=2048548 RepID=A0A916K6D4_9BACL|nr:amino acid ABC transporter ATP-binding protein [Paenibacillus solanacearum]CAG7638467.1 putative amino-acid import ATP-binding protein YxeO [Paenibacillus solanacearum]
MIKVTNLRKRFKDLVVLDGIDLEVNRGEVVAIIGPSGSGKSTLLRCLNLLEKPDDGIIQIGDATLDAKKYGRGDVYKLRKQTAMVFQNYNLFKNKTALQNVIESLIVTKRIKRDEARNIGMALLEQVGLAEKADSYPITLSGGQQQRVGIARALAVDPHAILFDEPTSALDPELVAEVLQVIKAIVQRQTTSIIVTHEMAFAREVADKVIFMADGNIVEQGTPEQLFDHPQNPRTKKFLQQVSH